MPSPMPPSEHDMVAHALSLAPTSATDSTTRRIVVRLTKSGPVTRYACLIATTIAPAFPLYVIVPLASPALAPPLAKATAAAIAHPSADRRRRARGSSKSIRDSLAACSYRIARLPVFLVTLSRRAQDAARRCTSRAPDPTRAAWRRRPPSARGCA